MVRLPDALPALRRLHTEIKIMPAACLPENEPERLRALIDLGVLDTEPNDAFDQIAHSIASDLAVPIAAISLVTDTRQWFRAAVGLRGVKETSRSVSFCAHAILTPRETLCVADATQDIRFADNSLVTGYPGIRAYAGVPLMSGARLPIGALCVIDVNPRTFLAHEMRYLGKVARAVETMLRLTSFTRSPVCHR